MNRNRFVSFDTPDGITRLRTAIDESEIVIIGAGAGLSTSAGFIYSGERFHKYFGDFKDKYHLNDMYSGGFYPFRTLEEQWAYWSRYIYINRYMMAPKPVYDTLFAMIDGRDKGNLSNPPKKDYFVLTTNVDHQFQKAGFAKKRIFYTQGDYGLWQCSRPCHKRTYNNKEKVIKMVLAQGFTIGENAELLVPEHENGGSDFSSIAMTVPSELIPYCPVCGEPMSMNLRADETFVEDEGWHEAAGNYEEFMNGIEDQKVLLLELGVGGNTPTIIKYNFWNMTEKWPNATYACLNYGEAFAPDGIKARSICINGDIGEALEKIGISE